MFIIKLVFKILAIPLIIALTILKWIAIIATGLMTGILFKLLTLLVVMVVIFLASKGLQDTETRMLLVLILLAYLLPILARKCISFIVICIESLKDFLFS